MSEDRDGDCMRLGTVGARAWGLLAASLCWVPPCSARAAGSWLGDLQTPVFWGGTGHQPSCLALLPVSPAARPLRDKHWGAAAWASRRRPRPCSPLLVRPVCGAVIPVARRGRCSGRPPDVSEATEPRGASANSGCARPVLPWTQRLHALGRVPGRGAGQSQSQSQPHSDAHGWGAVGRWGIRAPTKAGGCCQGSGPIRANYSLSLGLPMRGSGTSL